MRRCSIRRRALDSGRLIPAASSNWAKGFSLLGHFGQLAMNEVACSGVELFVVGAVPGLRVEGDMAETGLGDEEGRRCPDTGTSSFDSGHEQSIFSRVQFPQTGRTSSHLTRRVLHFIQPCLDLRWPTLAGRPLVSRSGDGMAYDNQGDKTAKPQFVYSTTDMNLRSPSSPWPQCGSVRDKRAYSSGCHECHTRPAGLC